MLNCFHALQQSETQQELDDVNSELQDLKRQAKDQKKELDRVKSSLEMQQRETTRLKGELSKERKVQEETTKSSEDERVSSCT